MVSYVDERFLLRSKSIVFAIYSCCVREGDFIAK